MPLAASSALKASISGTEMMLSSSHWLMPCITLGSWFAPPFDWMYAGSETRNGAGSKAAMRLTICERLETIAELTERI